MATALEQVIAAARTLSPRDQLALLHVISRDLHQMYILAEATVGFWNAPALSEILAMQPGPVVTDIRALAADFWPEDETADDINQFVAARRQSDRLK